MSYRDKLDVHPLLFAQMPMVEYNWSLKHGQNVPKGAIELTEGYIEKIDPEPVATFYGQEILLYPVAGLGIIAGSLFEQGPALVSFLDDMDELLFTRGMLMNYGFRNTVNAAPPRKRTKRNQAKGTS